MRLRGRKLLFLALAGVFACGGRSELPLDSAGAPASPPACPTFASPSDSGPIPIYVLFIPAEPQCASLTLLRFEPATAAFTMVGPIHCPGTGPGIPQPSEFVVDRAGIGIMVIDSIYHVDVATAACALAGPLPKQNWGSMWGSMAFTADDHGSGETLYAVGGGPVEQLASLEPSTLDAAPIAALTPMGSQGSLNVAQTLAGAATGELFTEDIASFPWTIARIDKKTGELAPRLAVPDAAVTGSAFAFWGGDLFFFASQSDVGTTSVIRVHPNDGSFQEVAHLPGAVLHVATPTTAPAQ